MRAAGRQGGGATRASYCSAHCRVSRCSLPGAMCRGSTLVKPELVHQTQVTRHGCNWTHRPPARLRTSSYSGKRHTGESGYDQPSASSFLIPRCARRGAARAGLGHKPTTPTTKSRGRCIRARHVQVPRHRCNIRQAMDSPAPAAPPRNGAHVSTWKEPGENTPASQGLTQPSGSSSIGAMGRVGLAQGLGTNPQVGSSWECPLPA